MLFFIYRALPIGGIETFFVRMAKERHKKGLKTAILLLSKPKKSNRELLVEMQKFATVYFYFDVFYPVPVLNKYFPLIAPIRKNYVKKKLKEIEQIHVFKGDCALLAQRLATLLNNSPPITIGFYHYSTYLWGGECVAHHEKINRKFVFEYLPKESLLFFSEGNRDFHSKHKGIDFSASNVFRLGVVDKKTKQISTGIGVPLKIVTVGRLIEFKTYNFYMLGVVKRLVEQNILVTFDVYGEGPLFEEMQKKIVELGLQNCVFLKGSLEYSLFDETVSEYDLFIGSGTAIIQAASLGVPSIVGVENVLQPKSYGYFSDVYQHEYNVKGLDLPLLSVEKIIVSYIKMTKEQRLQLKKMHLISIESFTNEHCQNMMEVLKKIKMPESSFKCNYWLYEASRAFDQLNRLLNSRHPYNIRHKKMAKIDKA